MNNLTMNNWSFETKSIHSGFNEKLSGGATSAPIHESAAFCYDDARHMAEVFEGRRFGYLYSRISNPTVTAFEQKINSLENGLGAIATSSGMAAIATVAFALTQNGDRIIAHKSLFGGTFQLFNRIFTKYGIDVDYLNLLDIDLLRNTINDKTRFIFVETLGNPKLDVPNISAIAEVAREYNIPLVVDSTLTTPYLFDSKLFGANIVIHSATKYLTGNGSAIGGVIVDLGNYDWRTTQVKEISDHAQRAGNFAFLAVARTHILQNTGSCLSPFNAYLHNQGLETLALRMERHCCNAYLLAKYLVYNNKVLEVNYPGLDKSIYHLIAKEQFRGYYGGIVTFTLGSKERCFKFIERMDIAKNALNIGDVRTLVVHPDSTIFYGNSKEEKIDSGVNDDLIRVSVGIENINDIINDFENSLESL